jgi:glycosyltransferase involved in cell wall biosynthesis
VNLVLVNHSHPDVPHISATRSWFFARELAKMGHRVVQICQAVDTCQFAGDAALLAKRLEGHDWSQPYLMAVPPSRRLLLDLVRSRKTPSPLRKALVAYSFAVNGGVFTDFSHGARPYVAALARAFRPDAVWGIFLDTDCWLIAQRLARSAKCPWVSDMKDSWDVFIPQPLRGLLARRFGDMAAATCNSEFNARVLSQWFSRTPTVVYSGVDRRFIEPRGELPSPTKCRITLTGGLYEQQSVESWVAGVRTWLEQGSSVRDASVEGVEIAYAGGDSRRAAQVLQPLSGLAEVRVHSYLPLPELAALCRSASVNAYIRTPKTFHHKLLELLSCGRPVLAFPGETDESRRLVAQCGGTLLTPTTEVELVAALQSLHDAREVSQPCRVDASQFSWARQAEILEGVFHRVVAHRVQRSE